VRVLLKLEVFLQIGGDSVSLAEVGCFSKRGALDSKGFEIRPSMKATGDHELVVIEAAGHPGYQ
jgi:hypothetical protein